MTTARRFVLVVASMLLAVAACSLPTDDEAAVIPPEDLPDVLRGDLEVTTTIDQGPRTEPITIWLLLIDENDRTQVVQVGREIDPQASFEQEIGLLFGPEIRTEEEIELGWFNTLTDFQLIEAFVDDGVAIIDMEAAVDENGEQIEVGASLLEDAIAQLVYSATGFPEADPIESVRIRIAGEAAFLPTAEGDSREVLTRADFEIYDPEYVPPPTTAPPTTTVPDPADVAPDAEGEGDGEEDA